MDSKCLVIASFIIDNDKVWNEYVEIDSTKVDINNLKEILAQFPDEVKDNAPKRITVIKNNHNGSPAVIGDWG